MSLLPKSLKIITSAPQHARIQEFSPGGGGVQVSLTKSSDNVFFFFFFFLVFSLFYRSQMVNFKEIYHFQGSRGVQHFPGGGGGSNFFQGGGGSNCLFPIETHITCDFPGGSGPPVRPPLDPHLPSSLKINSHSPQIPKTPAPPPIPEDH